MSNISKCFSILTFEVVEEGVYEELFTESRYHNGSVDNMLTRREDAYRSHALSCLFVMAESIILLYYFD